MSEIYKFFTESEEQRLDVFLQSKFEDRTRSHIKNLIEKGKVTVSGKIVKAGYKPKPTEEIVVELDQPEISEIKPEDIKLNIVYEDSDLAVINKPQGMVVHPARGCYSGTLVNALLFNMKDLSGINGEIRPGIVHRLDKDTSGLIVIAKNDATHVDLQKQIQSKTCHRIYRAIVHGKFKNDEGTITTYLARGKTEYKKIFVVPEGEGRLAITNYKVLDTFKGVSYMEFDLKTGRTHQIRVHCAHMGHPVVGDKMYGIKDTKYDYLQGQLLHAYKLEFIHPKTKQFMSFSAPLPEYFENILNNLKN